MFRTRSQQPERIDTGDYTPEEYDRFLQDIRLVNRFAGDKLALRRTLISEIRREGLKSFSVLDVGAGSGVLLRAVAEAARKMDAKVRLVGLELNERSSRSIVHSSVEFPEIRAVGGNALSLPFADDSFDFTISSLFAHHLKDDEIVLALREMSRVSRKNVYLIDLHRHPAAYAAYKVFCVGFRISPLVRHDGSLSILKGFKPRELLAIADKADLPCSDVRRCFPFRLVLRREVPVGRIRAAGSGTPDGG